MALLSHEFWSRRFGADPVMLGKTVSLGGEPHVVIGIVGAAFDFQDFGPPPDVWVPLQFDPNSKDQATISPWERG